MFAALALIASFDLRRARHVNAVTALGGWADRWSDHQSPMPYTALIVPEHINESYHWLLQTRQMVERRELRVRQIDYENAPFGRAVATASPYRWYLGVLAGCEHLRSGTPWPRAIEHAALLADPLLHILLLLATALLVAWRFGPAPAALIGVAMSTLFPFAAAFLPGAPDETGVVGVIGLWSLLLLVAALIPRNGAAPDAGHTRRWFVAAGIVAGMALWLNPAREVAVLLGVAIGAILAAYLRRPPPSQSNAAATTAPLPWRAWAAAGAVTTLTAYLIEYFPAHLGDWELRAVHPLYGLAWLATGELLLFVTTAIETRRVTWTKRNVLVLVLAILAIAAVPVTMWKLHDRAFLATNLGDFRLTKLPEGSVATSFSAWLRQAADSDALATVIVPLLLLGGSGWVLARATTPRGARVSLALVIPPVLITAVFALRQMAWWIQVDALFLAVLVATTAGFSTTRGRAAWAAFAALLCLPGALQIAPRGPVEQPTEAELYGLIERDIAEWLTQHAPNGRAVFLAPPSETTALTYYGGGNGIATLSWQNKSGLEAAVRILSASTPEEAKTLIERRGITHVIMPSWDPYLDDYARMGMGQLDGTFIQRLHQWLVPTWLRPVPYALPVIGGLEQQSVTMFEVVEPQADPVALSRTAEYFIELGKLDQAAAVGQSLRRFPADMNAWIARAEVETATGDEAALAKSLNVLLPYVTAKRDRTLPWDLRVGLAVVLARAKHKEQAEQQVRRCVTEMNETSLRALPTGALYRLLVLCRAYEVPITDAKLHALALDLLPPDARQRLQPAPAS
jgi:hypothetical protein